MSFYVKRKLKVDGNQKKKLNFRNFFLVLRREFQKDKARF